MSELSVFNFDTHALRTLTRNGEPWFVAADVCEVLTIGNPSLAINGRADREGSGLDEDERGIAIVNTPSGEQGMLVINESGLYSLILTSRKPEAKRFKKWVTSEVLPSIRKTGQYTAPKAKRTYTKSVSFGQELRAVLDLALELRYSTFERNQAVIALLERPGYEALLATLPDRFKQPSPQDEIPDMALAGYANVTWHEATATWRVAIGLPQGAVVPQIYVYCDKLSDAIQVAAGLQHHGCSTLPGDLVSTRSSLTGFHNAATRTLRSCGVAGVTVRNDGQYPGLVQVTHR